MSDLNEVAGAGAVDVDTSATEEQVASGQGLGQDASDMPMDVSQDDIDLSKIQPNKWYTFRIEKAFHGTSQKGHPKLTFRMVCQNEPHTGQSLLYVCTLQRHALFNLEALFSAIKFKAVAGWTPSQTYDREFQGFVESKMVEGRPMTQITKMKPVVIGG